jgi:putative hydrolase of the HAD superfamily
MVTATEVGFQKPDPRIFEAAMRRAGCACDEFAHVGDSLIGDVAGAKVAGAWAIWFNPSGLPPAGDAVPDAEVRTLSELPGLLERWKG